MNGQGTKRAPARSGERERTQESDSARESSAQPATTNSSVARTTAILPAALNENWEVCALQEGVPKNEVLVRALREYLIGKGLQPDKRPKTISIVY
jgi:hypothetical protein